ncbi:MAG: transglutaminase-like cysteine peptidase [Rhizobiaceae bacterium]|nr:transglutaminase-like cysteine peptidase [Rhizobiaceae bacterium]
MVRTMLSAAALMIVCVSAQADALHLNPSQRATATGMATFGSTSIPFGYYEYCQRYAERCSRPAEGRTITLTRDRWAQVVDINNLVNATVAPKTDMEIFGKEERWEYPVDAGDCEDYALQKRKLLNELGFPLGALLMTVGRDADGGGHAVLTVVTDAGDFVLDNMEERVLLWRDAELTYLKRQSGENPNVWVSLVSG